MAITSFSFLCFFAVVLLLYYLIPKRVQWVFLLLVSLFYFVSAGSPWLLLYPVFTITIVYWAALYVDRVKEQKKRKCALSLVVVFCLILLIVLKYFNFGIYTYNAITMRLFPGSTLLPETNFLIPLGISFYSLALLGYLFDVYYEISKPQKNYLKLMLFGIYFPITVSGPIMRYRDMEDSLYAPHKPDYRNITFGLQRTLWGLFKKLVIAERMAVIVNTVFDDYAAYPGIYIFVAAICFAFQLYTDFSGAMDIILGISETFGIKVAENFQTPFFAGSIQEFWRRWHITLGTWMKDYLFYPLLRTNGFMKLQNNLKKKLNKKTGKKIAVFIAMFVLWFAVGMWHGGAWKYIIGSGLLHWCYIVLGEITQPVSKRVFTFFKLKETNKGLRFLRQIRTFLLVSAGFVFFRAVSFTDGLSMFRYLFSTFNPGILADGSMLQLGLDYVEVAVTFVSLLLLLAVSIYQQKRSVREWLAQRNIVIRWIILYALLFYVILLGYYGPGYSASEFIYQGF